MAGEKQRKLIAEAAKGQKGTKPKRGAGVVGDVRLMSGNVQVRPAKKLKKGDLIPFTLTETIDLLEVQMSRLNMSNRGDFTMLNVGRICDELVSNASTNSLFSGLEKALASIARSVMSVQRQSRVVLGELTLELVDAEDVYNAPALRVELHLSRVHASEPEMPQVDSAKALDVLNRLFERPLVVAADMSDACLTKFCVAGEFNFSEDDSEDWRDAPLATTPQDAVLDFFYMVYAFLNWDAARTISSVENERLSINEFDQALDLTDSRDEEDNE